MRWTACPSRSRSPAATCERCRRALLRERLTGRLLSTAAAQRDLPDRQQTIPSTIDWSLQLLGPAEQRLFGLFSVFHGDVPLEAVEAVWADGDVVDPLSVLVDHSLVRRTTGYRNEPRFGMLALVRDHAARLVDGDREAARAGHAAYFSSWLDDLYERRWTDATYRWLDDIARCCRRCGRRTRGRRAPATCR